MPTTLVNEILIINSERTQNIDIFENDDDKFQSQYPDLKLHNRNEAEKEYKQERKEEQEACRNHQIIDGVRVTLALDFDEELGPVPAGTRGPGRPPPQQAPIQPSQVQWEDELKALVKRVKGEVQDATCKRRLLRCAAIDAVQLKKRCVILECFLSAVDDMLSLREYSVALRDYVCTSLSSANSRTDWRRITQPLEDICRDTVEVNVLIRLATLYDILCESEEIPYILDIQTECNEAAYWPIYNAVIEAYKDVATALRLRDDIVGDISKMQTGLRDIFLRAARFCYCFDPEKVSMSKRRTSIEIHDHLGTCLSSVVFRGQIADNIRVCDMIRHEAEMVQAIDYQYFEGDSEDLGRAIADVMAVKAYRYRNVTAFLNVSLQEYKNCVFQSIDAYQRFCSTMMDEIRAVMIIMRDENTRVAELLNQGYSKFEIRNQLILINPSGTIKIRIKKKVWKQLMPNGSYRYNSFFFRNGERLYLEGPDGFTGQYSVAMMPLNPHSLEHMRNFAHRNRFLNRAPGFTEQQKAYLFFKTSELFKFYEERGEVGCVPAFNRQQYQNLSEYNRYWQSTTPCSWPLSNYAALWQPSNVQVGRAYMARTHNHTCALAPNTCLCTAHWN